MSANLLVIGACPSNGTNDEPRLGEIDHDAAATAIGRAALPPVTPFTVKERPSFDFERRGAILQQIIVK